MEEIRDAFLTLREYPELLDLKCSYENELKDIENSIRNIEEENNRIEEILKSEDFSEIERSINKMSIQITEIECENIEITNIHEFIDASRIITDKKVLLDKSKTLISSLIELRKPKEGSTLLVFKLDLEDILNLFDLSMLSGSLDFPELQLAFSSVEINNFRIFYNTTELLIALDSVSSCPKNYLEIISIEFCKKYKNIFEIFKIIVLNQINDMMKNGVYEVEGLQSFFDASKDTSLFIKNLNEYILDVSMKEIIRLSKITTRGRTLEFDSVSKARTYSINILKITRIQKKIIQLKSSRKEMAIAVTRKAIKRFFYDKKNSQNIDEIILAFNDLVFYQGNSGIELEEYQSMFKEDLYFGIINYFCLIKSDFERDLENIKYNFKTKIFDFNEKMKESMDETRSKGFRATFFDICFKKFIDFVFESKFLNLNNSFIMSNVGEYLILQCNISPRELNYRIPVVSLCSILKATFNFSENSLLLDQCFSKDQLQLLSKIIPWEDNIKDYVNSF